MPQWIDFKELRQKLDFEKVLQHYGVEIKRKGDQHQGFCPLPTHEGERKKSESFSANLKRGIFQCFSCQAKGNILDFAVIKAGLDPENGEDVRRVALELQAKFFPELTAQKKSPSKEARQETEQLPLVPVVEEKPKVAEAEKRVVINVSGILKGRQTWPFEMEPSS